MNMTYFEMLWNLITFIVFFIFAYIFILQVLNVIVKLRFNCGDRLLLYPFDVTNDLYCKLIPSSIIISVLIVYDETGFDRLLKLAIIIFILLHHFVSTPDRDDVFDDNDLHIGYGAALWFYKNYLDLFLHKNFVERVKLFETRNDVKVLHKLFLLVPDSCVVPQTIDFEDEKDCIERCQELDPFKKTNAGIKERVYNHTVYLLRTSVGNLRMVIEYAQSCKGLYGFKLKNIITEREMARQCQLYVSSLQKFLHDEHDSYKYIEIVEFNDRKQKVSEALIQHCCF